MIVIPNRGRIVAVISALALAGGLLTLALLAKPSQAQPPTVNENSGATSAWYPLSFTIDSACAGELIDVTGTLHIVNNFTSQEDGTFHTHSITRFMGATGVGIDPETRTPSGTEYVIVTSSATAMNLVQSGEFVLGTMDLSVIIQKGPGTREDQTISQQVGFIRMHYILYDDGTVKVDSAVFNDQCH